IDDEEIGFHVGRDGKAQPGEHPRGVALHRRVDELLKSRERYDGVEALPDLGPRHPEDGAVEEDILPTGQVRMKTGADFDQGRKTAVHLKGAPRGPHDAAQELQDRALAGTVRADDAEGLAATHTER